MIKVVITDDHFVVVEGIKNLLKHDKEICLTQCFHNLKDLNENLDETTDVLLLDINLPDGNGIDTCKILLEKYKTLKIIAFTNYEDSSFIRQMIKNGAIGYLLKNTDKYELTNAIKTVYSGNRYLSNHLKDLLVHDSLGERSFNLFQPKLTSREGEILQLISQELTAEEIANKLFISIKTVESHKSNLFQKLAVKNSVGLVRVAFEKGLI